MTVIIRPALSVFRRNTDLIVIFGAFRQFEPEAPIDPVDVDLMQNVVEAARRYRQPLAFSRELPDMSEPPQGTWLPGCRPRIRDRVFEHVGRTVFANPEFRSLYESNLSAKIKFVGPSNDSTLSAAISDHLCVSRPIERILNTEALHLRSTTTENATNQDSVLPHTFNVEPLDYFSWLKGLRLVEYN